MVNQRLQNKPLTRGEKGRKKRPSKKRAFRRVSLIICISILLFIGIGMLKYGNIKKTNEQPKSFPVTVQN